MLKRTVFCLAICAALAASGAYAQSGGGRHGGGGGRGGGRGGDSTQPTAAPKPASQIEIIGVVKEIDTKNNRLTIDYEAVDALNWPHGSKPFEVEKPDLLKGVTVGEKVRFKLDSSQIWEIKPF
jgi:Cu/Ag efflux protein CusF